MERAGRSRGANRRHQIWHDVELFDIQLALRRAAAVVLWESEPEVKAANDFTTDRYAKDYDAVVTFRSGHQCGKVALEYERTPKSSRQYERICYEIDHDNKLEAFLYLVPNCELHAFLLHALRKPGGALSLHWHPSSFNPPHNAAHRRANASSVSARRLFDRRESLTKSLAPYCLALHRLCPSAAVLNFFLVRYLRSDIPGV